MLSTSIYRFISLSVVAVVASRASAQTVGRWVDPSPHTQRFVRGESGAKLEVLDWGGRGRTLSCLLSSEIPLTSTTSGHRDSRGSFASSESRAAVQAYRIRHRTDIRSGSWRRTSSR